ncbi:MAG: outer membrane receptor protein involved in Fe transport [Oleiphilaceae bacterium]|jgi:iron complex outermembrane receptor protein
MKKNQLKRSAIAIAVAGGLAAMPLQAQMLEEVIVTATKRAVGMQDVPIALSVMSGEKIAEAGITNLEDMAVFMPNVHIAEGSSSDSIFIRGIGSGINFGFEQSVGTFIDGIYFGRAQASRSSFLDIERVEVLKGSQSTLFGKNTIAGAISITTAKPTDEFEGSVQLAVEPEFGGQRATLTLSGPITDNFGARLVIQDEQSDGWMDNGAINQDEQQKDNQVGRLVLAWQPTENLDVGFKYETGSSDTTGTNEVISVASTAAAAFYTTADPNFAQNSGFGYDKSEATFGAGTPRRGEAYHDSDWDISTLTVEWALGEHTLKSITGYVDYSFETARDSDYSAIKSLHRYRDESHKQFTQEFLLSSPQSDTFEYLAGLFYQDEELQHNRSTDVSLQALFNAGVGLPPVTASGLFDGTGNNTFNQDAQTTSAFFEGTFHLSDTLRVIAGVRYSEDEKEFDKSAIVAPLFTTGPASPLLTSVYADTLRLTRAHDFRDGVAQVFDATAPNSLAITDLNTERKEEHVTGDLTVQWDFSEDTMLYAKYGNGYKAGGFDEDNAQANVDAQEYEDENSESIEFGAKMDLWEGRGRLNIALFHSEFEDVQVSTFDGTAGFIVGNAAESEVDGIELDGMFAVSEEITIFGAIAFLDANYKSFTDAACTAQQTIDHAAAGGTNTRANCLNDLSGERLQFAADMSANFGITYNTEITDSLELGLGADVMYTEDFDTAADADPVLVQDAYTKVNARISLGDIDGTWSLALLGKNLTDETTSGWGNDIPLGSFGFDNSFFQVIDAPRSYEVQATYNF